MEKQFAVFVITESRTMKVEEVTWVDVRDSLYKELIERPERNHLYETVVTVPEAQVLVLGLTKYHQL